VMDIKGIWCVRWSVAFPKEGNNYNMHNNLINLILIILLYWCNFTEFNLLTKICDSIKIFLNKNSQKFLMFSILLTLRLNYYPRDVSQFSLSPNNKFNQPLPNTKHFLHMASIIHSNGSNYSYRLSSHPHFSLSLLQCDNESNPRQNCLLIMSWTKEIFSPSLTCYPESFCVWLLH
jgi:hypothetical protein